MQGFQVPVPMFFIQIGSKGGSKWELPRREVTVKNETVRLFTYRKQYNQRKEATQSFLVVLNQ